MNETKLAICKNCIQWDKKLWICKYGHSTNEYSDCHAWEPRNNSICQTGCPKEVKDEITLTAPHCIKCDSRPYSTIDHFIKFA